MNRVSISGLMRHEIKYGKSSRRHPEKGKIGSRIFGKTCEEPSWAEVPMGTIGA